MFPADSCLSRVAQPIEFVGFWSRGPFRVKAALAFRSAASHPLLLVRKPQCSRGCRLQRPPSSPSGPPRVHNPSLAQLFVSERTSGCRPILTFPFHQVRFLSSNARQAAPQVCASFSSSCQSLNSLHQPSLASRTLLASASILTVGSIAWYTHLYGSLPFVGEVHANSPAEDGLHPIAYPWSHNGWLDTFDHARYTPSFTLVSH